MALSPIEQNYNFLNLTGKSRGVGAVSTYQPYDPGVAGTGQSQGVSGRAVDRLPKAEFVNYDENIPSQAGYGAGISHLTMWA